MTTHTVHNLYRDPFNSGTWIHSLVPIELILTKQLPEIAYNLQNNKLGVNGTMKVNRCDECTKPKSRCKCELQLPIKI